MSVIAASLECFPEKLSWSRNEQVCQRVKCKAFERSNVLDTALYIKTTFLTTFTGTVRWMSLTNSSSGSGKSLSRSTTMNVSCSCASCRADLVCRPTPPTSRNASRS